MTQSSGRSGGARFGKIAAIVSSVTLASLYIAYRSGGEQQVLPSSKFRTVQVTSTQSASPTTATTATSQPVFVPDITFYGSKSAPVFSSSKSAAIFLPADAATTQPTTAQIRDATTAPMPTE